MYKTVIVFAAMLAASASAQSTPRDEKLDLFASDLRALSRVAALADNLNDARQVMLAIVDNDIENLRERRTDGTYRWASLAREEASRVKDQKTIERVQSEKELREVALTAANAYRVEVSVPTKQSLISKNNPVYIRNVIVDSTGFDGKTVHQEIPVNAWVNPGDANGIALPEIGKSVKVVVELGVESGDKRAVADVALLQAKLADVPTSPYFPAVQRLLKIRDVIAQKDVNRGLLKSTIDEALLSVPGELDKRAAEQTADRRKRIGTGTIAGGDATPEVIGSLLEISRLLGSNLEDQGEARKKLQYLIDTLQGKTKQY